MIRNDFTEGMKKNLYEWFFEKYDEEDVVHPRILDEQPSNSCHEQSTSAVGLGKLDEVGEGEEIPAEDLLEGFTTYGVNKKFGKRVIMSEEMIDDHQKVKNLLKRAATGWGAGVRWTLEDYYAKIFNKGGITLGDTFFNMTCAACGTTYSPGNFIYDSAPLFAVSGTNHTSKGGSTYHNAVALALTPDNFETNYKRLTDTNSYNERDEKISLGKNIVCLVPPGLTFTARRIIESELKPGVTTNDLNVLRNIVEVIEWRYLSDTDAWFLGYPKKGLVAQKRKAPKIDFYYDDDHENYKAKISMRYGYRVDNWRYWLSSNLTTT